VKSNIKIRKGQVDWPGVWGVPSTNGQILQGNTDGEYSWIDAGANDKNFVHDQSTASNIWTINHGLEKYPSVTVFDSGGNQVEGEVLYTDLNNLTITFNGSFSGTATLN
jgi:hypothetical protein